MTLTPNKSFQEELSSTETTDESRCQNSDQKHLNTVLVIQLIETASIHSKYLCIYNLFSLSLSFWPLISENSKDNWGQPTLWDKAASLKKHLAKSKT